MLQETFLFFAEQVTKDRHCIDYAFR